MDQYLCLLRPCRESFLSDATEAESAVVGAHFAYLQQKLAEGVVILVGRTQEEIPTGIAVFEAKDIEAANSFVQNDPAVSAGVFISEIKPFKVALMRGS